MVDDKAHLVCYVCCCGCCYCNASARAWLPGWVPWCVAVGQVAPAGSTILGSPMVCLQASCCSCFAFRCSAAVSGHDNATLVDDKAHLLYSVCCCCCFRSGWHCCCCCCGPCSCCSCSCGFDPQTTRKRKRFSAIAFHRFAIARYLPLIGPPRRAVRRAAAELHRFFAFDCFRLVVCRGHNAATVDDTAHRHLQCYCCCCCCCVSLLLLLLPLLVPRLWVLCCCWLPG